MGAERRQQPVCAAARKDKTAFQFCAFDFSGLGSEPALPGKIRGQHFFLKLPARWPALDALPFFRKIQGQ